MLIVWNYKKYKPLQFAGSVIANSMELTVLLICAFFSYVLQKGKGMDWYKKAVELNLNDQNFYQAKTDGIFGILVAATVIISVFSFITLCVLRHQQLEGMKHWIGVLMAEGYENKKIMQILNFDTYLDIAFSVPFVMILFTFIMGKIKQKEEFEVLITSAGMDGIIFGAVTVLAVIAFLIIICIYQKYWLHRNKEKGIQYLIKAQGL